MVETAKPTPIKGHAPVGSKSRELIGKLREARSHEVVFAVVGYAGSGTNGTYLSVSH